MARRDKWILGLAITRMLDKVGRRTPRRAIYIPLSPETSTRGGASRCRARVFEVANASINLERRLDGVEVIDWMISSAANDRGASDVLIAS